MFLPRSTSIYRHPYSLTVSSSPFYLSTHSLQLIIPQLSAHRSSLHLRGRSARIASLATATHSSQFLSGVYRRCRTMNRGLISSSDRLTLLPRHQLSDSFNDGSHASRLTWSKLPSIVWTSINISSFFPQTWISSSSFHLPYNISSFSSHRWLINFDLCHPHINIIDLCHHHFTSSWPSTIIDLYHCQVMSTTIPHHHWPLTTIPHRHWPSTSSCHVVHHTSSSWTLTYTYTMSTCIPCHDTMSTIIQHHHTLLTTIPHHGLNVLIYHVDYYHTINGPS